MKNLVESAVALVVVAGFAVAVIAWAGMSESCAHGAVRSERILRGG